jgi:two-component system, response regulator, stage 0 sporulation protein F
MHLEVFMSEKTVYVIDDQIGIRILLTEVIESEGFEAKVFETGMDALKDCAIDQPELIFVDYHMPVMNGSKFVNQLNEKLMKKIPVVMMSGYSVEDFKGNLKANNIKEILLKPFDITDVINFLHKYI